MADGHGRNEELRRPRLGLVGLGLIAQVAHLPTLRLQADRWDVVALCDLSESALELAGEYFPDAKRTREWRDVLELDLDAVMVLTPGSHAPIAVAAARRGLHVFVEKPMCFSAEEGREMLAAAGGAGVVLMVGYTKRYDPAYERLHEEVREWGEPVRLVRVTTLEAPWTPYVAHHRRARGGDVPADVLAALAADDERRISDAIGTEDPVIRRAYRFWLLDSMVHELNAVRGLLGEPTEVRFADVWGDAAGVTATLAFGDSTECVLMWVDLPHLTRYELEIALYAADRRAFLTFPSPYLRNAPTELALEGGTPGEVSSWRTEHVVGYEEAFERELLEFHAAIVAGRAPRTPGTDAIHDVALCQAIVRARIERRPVANPTALDDGRVRV
ncbi:MAG: Gfo/Idh/MocA family oxidoreductase [Thermoleophilia bacterium]|nr:Gfo/Idh/MocA family oxidoreductase [Thermoleophilia bacterium]